MKTVKLAKIPKCSICEKNPARYDAPLVPGGPWGYICVECAEKTGVDLTIGSVLEEQGEQGTENKGKKVHGKDMCDLETIVMDGDREIECPLCGAMRSVEPDAGYTYTCEDCGASVRVPCIM